MIKYENINKKKISFYNTISSLVFVILSGIFGILLSRQIIYFLGSDYHGLNATVNQFIGLLLVLEGGISLASIIAIYKPYTSGNIDDVNKILYSSKTKFNKISLIILFIGLPAAFIYSLMIKSDAKFTEIIISLMISVITASLTIGQNTKYVIIFQSTGHDYLFNTVKIISTIIVRTLALVTLQFGISFIYLQIIFFSSIIVELICYKLLVKYKFSGYTFLGNGETIKIYGSSDVVTQKITMMLYGALPLLIISSTIGTVTSSIYFIYTSIYGIVKSVAQSFINAPRNTLGLLISKNGIERTTEIYFKYQYLVILISIILLTISGLITIPFIKMFYVGTSTEYLNGDILLIILITSTLELIHIPSGNLLNLNSNFKVGRNIQMVASVTLILGLIIGTFIMGFVGILIAILIAALVLALLEIIFVHNIIYKNKILEFMKITLPNIVLMLSILIIGLNIDIKFNGILEFIIKSSYISIIIATLFLICNMIFNRTYLLYYVNITLNIVKKLLPNKANKS